MKRVFQTALLFMLSALLLCVPALAAVDLDSPAYVVDDAGVLSEELENEILTVNETLWYECGEAEFVVVTVKYPPAGMDREEFAVQIFDTWNVGSAETNNGAVLVIYTEDDEFWLECGHGVYNSPYVDEIADMVSDDSAFYRALRADEDEKAVSLLTADLLAWYQDHYGTASTAPSYSGGGSTVVYSSSSDVSDLSAILALIVIILLLIIITSPFRCRRRYGRWGVWPFFYFSPWWPTRTRIVRPYYGHRPGMGTPPPPWEVNRPSGYYRPPSGYNRPSSGSRPSSSRPSSGWSSGSSFHSGGGFSGGSSHSSGGFHSGGSSFHGGGGHSGGGFGKR